MTKWKDKIRDPDCTLCPLHEGAEHVCLMGDGSRKATYMVVGEAPGTREDAEHRAFVGASGQLLRDTLEASGLEPSAAYITNVAKCRPPDNRTPTRSEVKTCTATYLAQELDRVAPDYILTVGNAALQGVTRKSGITKHRGRLYEADGVPTIPTYHPAAVLRNPRYRDEFLADVQRFARLVTGQKAPGQRTRVKLINSKAKLAALIRHLVQAEVIAFDLETTSLEEWHGEDSQIVCMGFSTSPGTAYVVPLYHSASPWRDHNVALRLLKGVMERPDARYVAHNGKFDCRWLAAKGIFVNLTFDTMLAAHMLNENRKKGLEVLSQLLLGTDAYGLGDDVKDAYNVPIKRLALYNGKDVDYTLRLYTVFKPQLVAEERTRRVFSKLMMPASNMLTKTEGIGIYLDPDRWKKVHKVAVKKKQRAVDRMLSTTNMETINFNSPQQVGRWLFEELGLPIIEETKTGNPSTREAVILRLAKDHPEVMELLEYRKWTKYLSTYIDPWGERADHHSRIHTNFKLFGTVTGRLSSDKPNLQQVPRDPLIRGLLGAAPGYVLLDADLSQIELRIAAMLAGETRMLRAFANGEDLHLRTAMDITGRLPSEVDSEMRKMAKAVNFGFLYGMGFRHFVDYAFENFGLDISEDNAKEFRDAFFRTYPRLLKWHDRQRRLAHRYGRVASPIGRLRRLPDVLSGEKNIVAEAERQAINSPVQSVASDLIVLSALRINERVPDAVGRIVALVHDEILMEVRSDRVDEVAPIVKEEMENVRDARRKFGAIITVPIVAELEVGQHWGETKPYTVR